MLLEFQAYAGTRADYSALKWIPSAAEAWLEGDYVYVT